MSLATIRSGIKEALADIPGLNTYGYLSLHPEPPCAVVGFDDMDPGIYLGQVGDLVHIEVVIYVGLSDDQTADIQLMGFVDDVLAALDDKPTLSGACSSMLATRVHDWGVVPLGDGGPQVLGVLVSLEILS